MSEATVAFYQNLTSVCMVVSWWMEALNIRTSTSISFCV